MKIKDPNQEVDKRYYYECPKELGFLEITLDAKLKVKSAIFIDNFTDENKNKKKNINEEEISNILPSEIKKSLDDYFENKKDIPLSLISSEIMGTDFQKDIWEVIKKVSFGSTITYSDMAEKVGKSNAAQAAGTACGKNPLALFIPCHRVVRKQDEDYGYSWGADRKKWLLDFEK